MCRSWALSPRCLWASNPKGHWGDTGVARGFSATHIRHGADGGLRKSQDRRHGPGHTAHGTWTDTWVTWRPWGRAAAEGLGQLEYGAGKPRDYVPRLKSHGTTPSAPPRLTHRDCGNHSLRVQRLGTPLQSSKSRHRSPKTRSHKSTYYVPRTILEAARLRTRLISLACWLLALH